MKNIITTIATLLCTLHAMAQAPLSHLQMVWQRNIGGTANEYGSGLIQMPSGDYVLNTTTFSDSTAIFNCGIPRPQYSGQAMKMMLSILDSNGNFAQHLCVPAKMYSFSGGMTNTNDGGFAITGQSPTLYYPGFSELDAYIGKFDANYNFEWQKTIYTQNGEDFGINITQLHDSSLVTVGYTKSINNFNYPFLVAGKSAPYYINMKPDTPRFFINKRCPPNSLGGDAVEVKQVNDSTVAMIGSYDVGGINTAIMFATMNLQATQVTHHYYGGGLTD